MVPGTNKPKMVPGTISGAMAANRREPPSLGWNGQACKTFPSRVSGPRDPPREQPAVDLSLRVRFSFPLALPEGVLGPLWRGRQRLRVHDQSRPPLDDPAGPGVHLPDDALGRAIILGLLQRPLSPDRHPVGGPISRIPGHERLLLP